MVRRLPLSGVIFSAALILAAFSFALPASAQAVLQAGPILNGGGHAPMYLYSSPQGLATVMDSGAAGGGPIGYGLSEKLLQARGAPGTGTGPFGAHDCDWSTYATNAGGANYLCFDPNIGNSTAAIVAGAVGAAHPSALELIINGSVFPLPGSANGMPFVASESILSNTPTSFSAAVTRIGFVAGDGTPPLIYDAQVGSCATNSLANDGGQCVNSSDGNSWRARFPAGDIDIREWGANTGVDVVPYMHTAWAANTGQCIKIPAGIWQLQSSTTFTVGGAATGINLPAPCFRGDPWGYHGGNGGAPLAPNVLSMTGTWMHMAVAQTGIIPFTIVGQTPVPNTGGDIFYANSNGFYNIGYYEDQPAPTTSGWTPNPYQYIFSVSNIYDINFDELMFLNTTHCINATFVGRLKIGKIYGEPLGTCLQGDQAFDLWHIDSINFWPYWNDNPNLADYLYQNVDPVVFGHVAGFFMGSLFDIGYHSGFKAFDFGNGTVTQGFIDKFYPDESFYGLWIDANHASMKIGQQYADHYPGPTLGWMAGDDDIHIDGGYNFLQIGKWSIDFVGGSAYHDAGTGTGFSGNVTMVDSFTIGGVGASTPTSTPAWDASNAGKALFAIDPSTSTQTPGTLEIATKPVLYTNQNCQFFVSTHPCTEYGGAGAQNNGQYMITGLLVPWTPSLEFGGSSAGITGTFGGTLEWTGHAIRASVYVQLSAIPAHTGASVLIAGLPYNCSGDLKGSNGTVSYSTNMASLTSPVLLSSAGGAGNTISMYEGGSTGVAGLTDNNFTATSQFTGLMECDVDTAWQ